MFHIYPMLTVFFSFVFFSDSGGKYTCGMFVCVSCVVCGLGCISRMYVKIGYTIIPLDCDLLIK